jgi:hypothetical protein
MKPYTHPIKTQTRVIGVDVAKATVVIHDTAQARSITVANTIDALRAALAVFASDDLLICEVTGGHELATLQAALDLGLPAHRADPARVKSFIRSHGGIAKTDAIDARWLARYGQERDQTLARWQPRVADRDALAGLVRHRRDLVDQRTQSRNRRGAPAVGVIAPFLDEEINFFDQQIAKLDRTIAEIMDRTQTLADDQIKLRSLVGVGPVVAWSLLAFLPELGSLGRRQIASLAGLAPHPHQSGQTVKGTRTRGGRAELRPILFMAALSAMRSDPDTKAFADRLACQGKPKRLILNAIARKLVVRANALLRPQLQLT